jgi:hypothetical protein
LRDLLVAAGLGIPAFPSLAQVGTALPGEMGAPSVVPATVPSAESSAARLEQLRHAMIDQALDAPVHISSNAWLDESGRLRHVSRFFSEVRARAAADLITSSESAAQARATAATAGSEKDGKEAAVAAKSGVVRQSSLAGQPSAPGSGTDRDASALSRPVHSSAPADSLPPAPDALECRPDRSGLRRSAVVRFELVPVDGARGHSVLNHLQDLIQQAFSQHSGRSGLTVTGLDLSGIDSYSRLISSTGRQDAPYRIEVRISSDRLDAEPAGYGVAPGQTYFALSLAGARRAIAELERPPVALMPDRRVDIDLSLVEVSGERTVLRHRLPVLVPGAAPSHNTPVLPDSTVAAVTMATLAWWSEAVSLLRCEPMLVQAQPVGAGVLAIPLGGAAGIRVGDRWMIADRAKIPTRVLEQGAVDRIIMAEVVAVGQHRSTLRLTAESAGSPVRPGLERGVPWFASPL